MDFLVNPYLKNMHSEGTLDKTYLGVKQLKINRTVLQFYIFIMLIDLLFIIKLPDLEY